MCDSRTHCGAVPNHEPVEAVGTVEVVGSAAVEPVD